MPRTSTHAQSALEVAADLILVACVKQKLGHPAPSRDLYTSDLLRKEREYAERAGVPWFVLSAKHGLVAPDEELEPYDLHLTKTSAAYRDTWGSTVLRQLQSAASPLYGRFIELHAAAAYVDAIRDRLGREGAQISEPLAGLRLGPRLAWYRTKLTAPLPHSDVTGSDSTDARGFIKALLRQHPSADPG